MRRVFSISLFCALLTMTGCISTVQRAFDPTLNAQQNQIEIETMFPAIPGFYAWLGNDFIQATESGTKALPATVKFGYRSLGLTTNVPANCVYVRSELDYWGFFNRRKEYMSSFKVQEDVVTSFCSSHGYTIKRYKFDFTKQMLNYFGLKDLTRVTTANEYYGYSYVIYGSDGAAIMIYTPVIFGEYSKYFKDINTYYWDAIFVSTRESEKFLGTLSNTFLSDMETR